MRPVSAALIGLFYAVASSLVIFALTFALGMAWVSYLGVEPDFMTNRINWMFAGMVMLDLIILPIILIVMFCFVLPIRYKRLLSGSQELIDVRKWLTITLVIVFIPCIALTIGSPLIVMAILAIPLAAGTAGAFILFTGHLNKSLSRKAGVSISN
jgi:hypothetical protein